MTDTRAFPSVAVDDRHGGMSQRDWFAGQALAGIAATLTVVGDPKYELIAADCYRIADALLAERDRQR